MTTPADNTSTEPVINPVTNEPELPRGLGGDDDASEPDATDSVVADGAAPTTDAPVTESKPDDETPDAAAKVPVDPFAEDTPPEPKTEALSAPDKEELEYLRGQRSEVERQSAVIKGDQELQDLQRQFTSKYVSEGYDETEAQRRGLDAAQIYRDADARAKTEIDKSRQSQQFATEKNHGADVLSQQYGVDRNFLLRFNTWPDMEEAAKERQSRIKDRTEFDARLNKLETGTVEDGSYDTANTGTAELSNDQLLAAAGDPNFVMTPAHQERLTKHLELA